MQSDEPNVTPDAEEQPKHSPRCICSHCVASREAETTREAQAKDSSISRVQILNPKTGTRMVEHTFQPAERYIPMGGYGFKPEQEEIDWNPDPYEDQGAGRHCNVLKGLRGW